MNKLTLEEKKKVLDAFCHLTHNGCCHQCPMRDDNESWCGQFSCLESVTDEQADRDIAKYNLLGDSKVNHPSHYTQGGIECIDAMVAAYGKEAVEIFCLLNAFKYCWRAEHKNGEEDLNKAIWYLTKRLELSSSE